MIRFDIITIFPEGIAPLLGVGVVGAAQENGYVEIRCHDLRDYTDDPHCVVDDRAYGGGPGMVMKVEPFVRAIEAVALAPANRRRILLLSSQGRLFRQADARDWSELDQLVLLCGRYQGVDERLTAYVDEEISIGDFVIAGGESAAAVVVEATARMAP
ncbi:tRNA (guanosine(37)-N1)-methyltransferase TrmD, partial [Candidatus Bipolaricaulota bacterium]|nr:tRNA (guanosine(37)-N1)-methyltransferase TrmD [Candidatus Bipolaricaulota bacterium]